MPLKRVFRENVREQMRNLRWRDAAFKALDVLQDKDPAIILPFEDGESLKIRFMDIYCQNVRADLIHFEDLILTALAWQDVLSSQLIYRVVQVREPPYSDKEHEGNRDILNDMVKHYPELGFVKADFWGGNQGADGYVEFDKPFIRGYSGAIVDEDYGSSSTSEITEPVDGIRNNFPLEVGYCMPDQMEFHLRASGCVARFPYRYDFIIFFESLRELDKRR